MVTKARTGLTSLERLERQLQTITPDRAQGDAWEKALKGWINAGGHPELTKAWMWGEWPGKLKAGLKGDKGVDLVAETRDKQLVAIQVKFRRDPKDPVTAPEVQKLVGSYRKHFALFALASNAWSATRGVSEAVGDEDAMLILREQLLESNYDWAAKKSIQRTKFTPFPFQKVAAENVRKALAKGGRAQIVMACGTGKTVTMLLAADALDAQRVLVLAPTLLLVKQLRDEWISKRRPDREWASLAVCSDIGDGMDASEIAPAEFGAPPTTNPDEIAAFLKKPGRRVVFGTYASSDRIAKAQKKAGVPSFDLAVADEAHRIAGVVAVKDKSERSHRVMLEEKEIKAVRRLFATATPRITGSKKTRDGDEILIESMDDESRFGKVAHSVTFQEAVKLKRLVPYKLVVTIVTNDEVADAVLNRRFIDVKGKPYAADEVATAIAIRRAYKELGISKIISYHSRVAGAKSFADLITKVPGRGTSPVTEHVAGSMPVNDRKQVLNRLAAATEPYLVTNARCLTEGIDVPALDAVAFADPRKSQVDIVQAVGRAMRKPMGKSKKTTGYIILPVYLTKKELKDPETAVEGSAFEPVLQVLRALKDHDPFMAKFMAKILVAKGKKPHQKAGGIGEILEVSIGAELDKVLARRLLEAVQLRAIEVASDRFEIGLQHLIQYRARIGDCLVPPSHKEGTYPLGIWVMARRSEYHGTRGGLKPDRIAALNAIGFVWDLDELQWRTGIAQLKFFYRRFPGKAIPRGYRKDNFNLWQFEQTIRIRHKKGQLTTEQVNESVATGLDFNPFDTKWSRAVKLLVEYINEHGSPDVPQVFKVNRFSLGAWLNNQRQMMRDDSLSPDRKNTLLSLGVDPSIHDPKDHFAKHLAALKEFTKTHGTALVPRDYTLGDIELGKWTFELRQSRYNRLLSKDQRLALDALGFIWDMKDKKWELSYIALNKYVKENGTSLVPVGYQSGSIELGRWVSKQRDRFLKGTLRAERVRRLNALGMVWDALSHRWNAGMTAFRAFRVKHPGQIQPTTKHVEKGFRLGQWIGVCRLRHRQGKLTPKQILELERLNIVWDPPVGGRAHR